MNITEKEYKNLINHTGTKQNKYYNKKIWIYDGIPSETKLPGKKTKMVFDSKKEYNHWLELKLLEEKGIIKGLCRQKAFEIIPDFTCSGDKVKGIKYKADFCYYDENGKYVIEDVKPFSKKNNKYITTKEFDLKWKMMKFKYPEYIYKLI